MNRILSHTPSGVSILMSVIQTLTAISPATYLRTIISVLLLPCVTACNSTPAIPDSATMMVHPSLISDFNVIVPINAQLCNSNRPWQNGASRIPNESSLRRGECFGVEISVSTPAQLFIFNEDADGHWQYIPPALGKGPTGQNFSLQKGDVMRFPAEQVFDVASPKEHIHAFAVTNPIAATNLKQLVSNMSICCQHTRMQSDNWSVELQRFYALHPESTDWRSVSVNAPKP